MPLRATVSENVCAATCAVTDRAVVIDTVQVASAPLQAPVQPVNVENAPADAVNVTVESPAKVAVHVGGHAIPTGSLATVPSPVPVRVTDRRCGLVTNLAVTCASAVMGTRQVVVPAQAPDQSVNIELGAAVAVRFTTVPPWYVATHAAPQRMPAGPLVTVPAPPPSVTTVSVDRPSSMIGPLAPTLLPTSSSTIVFVALATARMR